jgi:AhpC/TSA family
MSDGRESGPLDFDDDAPGAPARPPAPPARPPAPPARPPRPGAPMGTKYLWVVGAAATVLILMLLLSTVRHGTERGARGVPAGETMPPFAVPTALSEIEADANLARRAGEGEAGDRPACSVRGAGILNGCALGESGPVVLAFFGIRSRECVEQLDAMQKVSEQLTGVQFAAVSIRGDRDDLRKMVLRHHWTFPVGYDRDGALSNAFHVQVCPQITFARRGGTVVTTTFGKLAPADLAARARKLAGT